MARPEITERSPDNPVRHAAYTIPEFCDAHRISEAFYYKARAAGQGPRERRILKKVIITEEAAAEWREAQTAPETI